MCIAAECPRDAEGGFLVPEPFRLSTKSQNPVLIGLDRSLNGSEKVRKRLAVQDQHWASRRTADTAPTESGDPDVPEADEEAPLRLVGRAAPLSRWRSTPRASYPHRGSVSA